MENRREYHRVFNTDAFSAVYDKHRLRGQIMKNTLWLVSLNDIVFRCHGSIKLY